MSVITSIKPQKNKKRVNVYLDDKFGFGLDLESLTTLNLREGTELTEKEINKIVKKGEFQKVYDKLLRFSTLRPRSEKELKDWLKKHKVHQSLQVNLFNRLKRLDLLNDNKFANWWVEQRVSFHPISKKVLSYELAAKGIVRNTIEDVLSKVEIDEEKNAKSLLKKKAYRWQKLPKLEKRKKMSEFLARKGFGWGSIKKAIDASHQKD